MGKVGSANRVKTKSHQLAAKQNFQKMNCSKGQNREMDILVELPIPKKKILLSMEVITEERNMDSKCSSQLDQDKKLSFATP